MSASIVVLGATGYAGGLAVHALLDRGVRPVVVGSREQRIRPLAEELGLEWRIADAADGASVRALVGSGDVLVTTVGPFDRLGRTVAAAAVAQGAHYVDSTGEVGFVRHLVDAHDAQARANGSVMLPAFGYDYVPGLLAGALAVQQGGDAVRSLEIGYFVRGSFGRGEGLSQGTRRTITEELGRPVLVWRDGRLQERRMAARVAALPHAGDTRQAVLAGGSEVLFLPRHAPRLQQVEVFNGWFPDAARTTQLVSAAASAVRRTTVGRRALAALGQRLVGPAGGPDAATRARSQGDAVAVGRDAAGQVCVQVELDGPNSYDITAELMAWAAAELAQGHGRTPGVVDGIDAFGLGGLRDAAAAMGLAQRS